MKPNDANKTQMAWKPRVAGKTVLFVPEESDRAAAAKQGGISGRGGRKRSNVFAILVPLMLIACIVFFLNRKDDATGDTAAQDSTGKGEVETTKDPQIEKNDGNENGIEGDENTDFYKEYKIAASQNNNMLMYYYLGCCYYFGQGVEKNYKYALSNWYQAAELGSMYAQYALGKSYYHGEIASRNYDEAVKYFQMAADKGHIGAQSALGVCYYWGQGVSQNRYVARQLFEKSAAKGDAKAREMIDTFSYY